MEMTKVWVSGYFKTLPGTDKESVTFSDFVMFLPHRNEEYFQRDVKRMFPVYQVKDKELGKHRFEGLIRIDVDDFEDYDGVPMCVGKDIKNMSWEELQDLSCYLNIREIKLYKSGSLKSAQENAYMLYQERVLKKRVFKYSMEIDRFEEEERQRGMRLGLSAMEVQERIDDIKNNSYMMITYPDDLKKSYNFSKVPSIIIDNPEKDKEKVEKTKNKE